MLYPYIRTYTATWNDPLAPGLYTLGPEVRKTIEDPDYYVSKPISINITPNYGLEEVMTEILCNKLDGNAWKQCRFIGNGYITEFPINNSCPRNLYMRLDVVEAVASEEEEADAENVDVISNKKFLPIPSQFNY